MSEPTRFRKKPVVIEAWQFTEATDWDALGQWCGAQDFGYEWQEMFMDIPTMEGVMRAAPNDWIIKGVAGEFYPCKPDIFAATYDREGEQP